jgi:hypothetical protein
MTSMSLNRCFTKLKYSCDKGVILKVDSAIFYKKQYALIDHLLMQYHIYQWT